MAFLRIDDRPIRVKSQIYQPDCIMVLDARLPRVINIFEGIREGGTLLLNSSSPPETGRLTGQVARIITVDATGIAKQILGTPITNTAMVGVFARAYPFISLETIRESIARIFSDRQQVELNFQAARLAYERAEERGDRDKWICHWPT